MSRASVPVSELQNYIKTAQMSRIELSSGLEIVGHLKNVLSSGETPIYLQFDSAVHLDLQGHVLLGQDTNRHPNGFSSPLGLLKNFDKPLEACSEKDLQELAVRQGSRAILQFQSGVKVAGLVHSFTRSPKGILLLITFSDCMVTLGSDVLFDPTWGEFDMAIGTSVVRAGAEV